MAVKVVAASYCSLVALLVSPNFISVPIPLQMMGLSTLIIIISSFSAAERERKRILDGDDADARDVIGRDQAYRFPLVASCALLGMFMAFKYLPKDWVSFLLTLYGVTFGGMALGGVLGSLIQSIPSVPAALKKEFGYKNYISMSACDLIGIILAAPVAYWYYITKAWMPNNMLACALALSAIDILAISDFQSSAVLLCGLFIYDVFWVFGSKSVFGSNVMVSVAKQFEGPIKLLFPRFFGAGPSDTSMLGLGDIVIPGLFVALMLRFDIRKVAPSDPIPTKLPYFAVAVVAYVLGLLATYVALSVFEAAQPALLYLVPSLLLASLIMSAASKEFMDLIKYTEEEEGKDEKKPTKVVDADSATDSSNVNVAESKKDQ